MKMMLQDKLSRANSALFFWTVIMLFFALVAAALDFFFVGKLLLLAALAVYILSKVGRLAEIFCLMPEATVLQRMYLTAVNLILGGGALLILIYLVKKHSGE